MIPGGPFMRWFEVGERACRSGARRRRVGELVVLVALLPLAGAGLGQEGEARFSNWSKVESPAAEETKKYKDSVKAGTFDAAARGFLEEVALPQLSLEANRATIERVRKRIREYLLADIDNDRAAEEASKTVLAFMNTLAANDEAEPVVRVNAMLLIGELQAPKSKQPWPAATAPLAEAVANAALPRAVRIAACVGLARHVEAAKGIADEQKRVAALALPAIAAVLAEPVPAGGGAENDWMAARCVAMLPVLGPLTPATAADAVRLLGDGGRSINARVRAAAAVAAGAGPEAKLDKAAVIAAVAGLAVAALEADVAAAERLALDREYSGTAAGQGLPGGPLPAVSYDPASPPGSPLDPTLQRPAAQWIPREACRRAAWRLAVLADAILSDDAKRGLATLGGDVVPEDKTLAQSLRRAALELDAAPEEATLRQVLAELKPPEPATPEDEPDAADAAVPAPAPPRAPPAGGR